MLNKLNNDKNKVRRRLILDNYVLFSYPSPDMINYVCEVKVDHRLHHVSILEYT